MAAKRARVLVCDPISARSLNVLRNAGLEVSYSPEISPEELLRSVPDYEVLIVRGRTKVTKAVIQAGGRLKIVGRAGVGVDNIDLTAAKEAGIQVLSTPEASTSAVAELVLGLMLAVARRIPLADASMRRGEWRKNELFGAQLAGKTLGIIGMGRIGAEVGRLARAFGMKIIGHDIIPIREEIIQALDATMGPLEYVLPHADFVTLHVPATPETTHLINYERIALMKRSAYLINTSRGSVVDEEGLARALQEGIIAGAALDVFEREPPVHSQLLSLPSVVLTPHIGGQTIEAQELAGSMLAEKIAAALAGRE